MDILSSIILGIVQGITEFLPVSSTGHLILAHAVLGSDFSASPAFDLAFDAILHLATALAVTVYFFKDILLLVQTVLRKLARLPVDERDFTLVKALIIGTIPAVVLGFLLESTMESLFRNPVLVACVLISGSFLFMYAEYVYQKRPPKNMLTVKTGFKIGLFQSLALIPGMSRSGSTIAGGMILGLTRSEAARFSFLLALPVILGAGAKKILDLLSSNAEVTWLPIIVGAVVAFVVGLCAIHFMITFVRKHTLWPFIWYRITVACLVILVTFYSN